MRAVVVTAALLTCACASGPTAGPASTAASVSRTATPSPSATASLAPPSTVLVFQSSSAPGEFHYSLTGPDGAAFKSIDATGLSANTWQGDGAALLLIDSTDKKYAVLHRDGTVTPIADSLGSNFDFSQTSFGQVMGDPIFVDNHTVLGIEGYGDSKYEVLDLTTGLKTTLLTVSSTRRTGGIQPASTVQLGLSSDRKLARVLVRHAVVNSTDVPQWALVEIDLGSLAVSSIKPLPVQSGLDSFDAIEPALSPDGRFLAYQEGLQANAQNFIIYTTHIVDLKSGRNTALVDRTIQCIGNSRCLRFSPDGTTLMAYGNLAVEFVAGGTSQSLMAVFDTSNGLLLWRQNVGDESSTQITPAGWIGPHTLVYTVTTTTTSGNFTNGAPASHALDAATSHQIDYPTNLGTLVAILT